jgi:hypothetical protein
MSDLISQSPQPTAIEHLLTALAGIVSARAITSSNGQLEEIHILATAELSPKQIVRNIESALSAGLGVEIDRRIVSIAQLRAGAGEIAALPEASGSTSPQAARVPDGAESTVSVGEAPYPARDGDTAVMRSGDIRSAAGPGEGEDAAGRLIFLGHEVTVDLSRTATCTVSFRMGTAEFTGEGTGFDTPQGRAEAAARAVFDAFDRTRTSDRVGLEGVAIVDTPGRECILVTARPLAGRRVGSLTGVAPIRESHEEAAILAALQATKHWRTRR